MNEKLIIGGIDIEACFKQFQQLKEEYQSYSELSAKCTEIREVVDKLIKKNIKLEKENKRLTEIVTCLENYKRFYKETHAKLDELDCVRGYYKFKQALAEIKAISEKFIGNVSENCINITPMYLVHKEILQKISEVEG